MYLVERKSGPSSHKTEVYAVCFFEGTAKAKVERAPKEWDFGSFKYRIRKIKVNRNLSS